jgi:hypothetical protein
MAISLIRSVQQEVAGNLRFAPRGDNLAGEGFSYYSQLEIIVLYRIAGPIGKPWFP